MCVLFNGYAPELEVFTDVNVYIFFKWAYANFLGDFFFSF